MLFLQLISLVILFIIFCFFVLEFYNIVFKGFAPFISTRKNVIDKIIEDFEVKDDTIVHELGCGKAGFLRAVRKKNAKAELIGIEKSPIAYIIAQIQNSLSGNKIKIFKKNFFNDDVSKADIIYCFLNIKTMAELKDKFLKECKNGAMIVSYQFSLPDMEPEKKIVFDKSGEVVYFYKIQK